MRDEASGPIVVGVDDDSASLNAVRYAVAQAASLRYPVTLVHGYGPPIRLGRYGAMNLERVERSAQRLVDGVAEQVELPPGATVETAVYCRSAVDSLLHAAGGAAYVVVGHRARRLGPPLAPGSIASRLSGKAERPVVTVPVAWSHAAMAARPVVVALDGETPAHWPLGFAFHQSDVMGTALVILHALPGDTETNDEEHYRATISESLVEWRARYPDVTVLIRFISGDTHDVLANASLDASLLVVGKPHEYPGFGLWTGSTAKAVLTRSSCPFAVVPQTLSDTRAVMPGVTRPSMRPD